MASQSPFKSKLPLKLFDLDVFSVKHFMYKRYENYSFLNPQSSSGASNQVVLWTAY
jgi:hypothetical protein